MASNINIINESIKCIRDLINSIESLEVLQTLKKVDKKVPTEVNLNVTRDQIENVDDKIVITNILDDIITKIGDEPLTLSLKRSISQIEVEIEVLKDDQIIVIEPKRVKLDPKTLPSTTRVVFNFISHLSKMLQPFLFIFLNFEQQKRNNNNKVIETNETLTQIIRINFIHVINFVNCILNIKLNEPKGNI
jgi:hypothetical protein